MTINAMLVQFEEDIGCDASMAFRILGIAYSTYAAYRNGGRALPLYHEQHIKTIYRLPRRQLHDLIKEYENAEG